MNGGWIETFTGKPFWPMNPNSEDIDIVDIAHALAQKCRFTGHCSEFYSVAQHCVLMSYEVPLYCRLEALLHDASEAYLPDIAHPLRQHFPEFNIAEDVIHKAVAKRFELTFPFPDPVLEVDRRIVADEAIALMVTGGRDWELEPRIGIRIHSWQPKEAERKFLERYNWLTTTRHVEDPWHFKPIIRAHAKKVLATIYE